jgi:hypothetical protein
MSTELKKDGTLNLNPMLGVYDRHPRGSALWAEALAMHVQSSVVHLTREEGDWTGHKRVVRILNDALKSKPQPWQVFPKEAQGNPEEWMRLVTGMSWKQLGDLIERRGPGTWAAISEKLAEWEAKNRELGAPVGNQNAACGKTTACDTGDCLRDVDSARGIRRRIQKRANDGDPQAIELVSQLTTGDITVNQAAIAAGMRQRYIRLRTDQPTKAAKSIVQRVGHEFAAKLAIELAQLVAEI